MNIEKAWDIFIGMVGRGLDLSNIGSITQFMSPPIIKRWESKFGMVENSEVTNLWLSQLGT